MTGRVRPAVALLLVALVGTMLWWPVGVAAVVPVANPDSFTVQKNDGAIPFDVLDNDTTSLGDTIASTTSASHGTVAIAVDGPSVTYTPTSGYSGPDSFNYTVTNTPAGGSTATVTVDAPPAAVDDPGSACFPPDFGGSFPIAEDSDQFAFTGSCTAIANDTDSDGSIVAWQIVALPSHGTLTGHGGTDSATVQVNVAKKNKP